MKKYSKLIILLFIVLFFCLIYLKFPKNYQKEYKVGKFDVQERYIKKTKSYYFIINNKFEYAVKSKYSGKHLIKKISFIKDTKEECINIKGKKIEFYPLCKNNVYSISGIDPINKTREINKKYNDIEINSIRDEKIYVWNHTGYYMLTKNKNQKINLYKNEYYYNDNAFTSSKYLITPNYEEKHEYKSLNVIDMEKGKNKTISFKKAINYNSYYLGTYKKLIYLVDRKNKDEIELNVKKETVKSILDNNQNGRVFDNGWKNVSITKLSHNDYSFEYPEYYSYKIKNKRLYLNYFNSNNDILISNHKVNKIISYNDDFVYYLYKDKVYSWSYKYGEVLILKFSELDFNSNNQIFIY